MRRFLLLLLLFLCVDMMTGSKKIDMAFVDVKRIVLTSSNADDVGQRIRKYTGSLIRVRTSTPHCHRGFLHKSEEEVDLFQGISLNETQIKKKKRNNICPLPNPIRLECPDLNITSSSSNSGNLRVEPPEDVPGRMFSLLFKNQDLNTMEDDLHTFNILLLGENDEIKWGDQDSKGNYESRCTIRLNETIIPIEPIVHSPKFMPLPQKNAQIGMQLHTVAKILSFKEKTAQMIARDENERKNDEIEREEESIISSENFPATKTEIEKAKETVKNMTRVFIPDTDFSRLMNRYVGSFVNGIVEVASAKTTEHHPIHSDTTTNKQKSSKTKLHDVVHNAIHHTIRSSSKLYPNITDESSHDVTETQKRAIHHRRVTAANARNVMLSLIETQNQVETALRHGVRAKEVFAMIIDMIMNMMPEIICQLIIGIVAPILSQLLGMILSCILPPILVPSEGEVPCQVADKKGKKMKTANEKFTKPCKCNKNNQFFFLELDEYNALNKIDALNCECSENEEDLRFKEEEVPGFLEDPPDNAQNDKVGAAIDPIEVMKTTTAYMVQDMLNAQAYPAIEAAISNALTGRLRDELGPSLQRSVTRELTRSLVVSLSTDITRELLGVLTHTLTVKSTKELTRALIPSLVMSLSQSLTRTLKHDPKTDYYCFECKENKVYCKECEAATKREEWDDYYTNYYATYYAKYNAEEYGKDNGIADAISARQLMKQRPMQQTTRGGKDRWWLGSDGI